MDEVSIDNGDILEHISQDNDSIKSSIETKPSERTFCNKSMRRPRKCQFALSEQK